MNQYKITSICILTFFALLGVQHSYGQLVSSEFGQNRIQYEQHKWMRYISTNFAFSYAEKDEELTKFVLPVAEMDYVELTTLFEHQLRNRIEVIVYSDYSNYEQSNIGIQNHSVNKGGTTQLLAPKIEVYFNGDHQDLRKQIRRGIARSLIMRILFGTNLQEVVQNTFLMNLPQWFVQGIIGYASEEWNTTRDNELREALLSKRYENFTDLARKQPELAGQSLFHFISEEYGASTVANLLYLTRINRSVENGFLYVFGNNFYNIVGTNWWNFYTNRYNSDGQNRRFPNKGELSINLAKNEGLQQVSLNPNGTKVAYVQQQQGKFKVYVHDVENDKATVVFKGGLKDPAGHYDSNYPLLGWTKSGQQLIVIYQKNNKIRVRYQGVSTKSKATEKIVKDVDRVTHFAVANSQELVLTALKNGYSDIYSFKNGALKAITQDHWDEAGVAVVNLKGERGVVFASNRPHDKIIKEGLQNELPLDNKDLFFYSFANGNKDLIRLTNTPFANESHPKAIDKVLYSYLSDENGIKNRYIGKIDTIISHYNRILVLDDESTLTMHQDSSFDHIHNIDSSYLKPVRIIGGLAAANTDYSRSIEEHDVNSSRVADVLYRSGEYHLFVRDVQVGRAFEIDATKYRQLFANAKSEATEEAETTKKERPESEKIEEDYAKDQPVGEELPAKVLELDTTETITNTSPQPDTTKPTPADTAEIDIDNYEFQSEFEEVEEPTVNEEDPEEDIGNISPIILTEGDDGSITAAESSNNSNNISSPTISNTKPKLVEFDDSRKRKYKNLFRVKNITFQMDNTPMFGGLNMYLGENYQMTPWSMMFKTSFIDIFENYYLELGVRMPLDFNGMEYFMTVANRKSRLDQKYSFYRRSRIQNYILSDSAGTFSMEARGRNLKHLLQTQLSYPLSKFHSVKGTFNVQLEKVAILSEEVVSLVVPNYMENRLGITLEYVFDNTVDLRLNTRKGTRYKVFLDMYKPFSVETDDKFKVGFEGGLTTAIGFDFRHYLSLDDKTIIAVRAAGASSFGQQKILYSLGGVENWLLPQSNTEIPLPPDPSKYGLQALAANLRGFRNNIRNGSSYALINTEIRVPIIEYITRRPPRNASFRNLQLVGFFDVGTAWHGSSPFSADNPLNTTLIDNSGPNTVSPIRVKVDYYRKPIVMGFGFGLRTVFVGHYIRLDYAWGIETGDVQRPKLYLSIGTDF
ncbi:MAG: hypothetical protein GY810_16425 [Aureispira sp.]|nr:hypothetical protein [Aureispira sp.]